MLFIATALFTTVLCHRSNIIPQYPTQPIQYSQPGIPSQSVQISIPSPQSQSVSVGIPSSVPYYSYQPQIQQTQYQQIIPIPQQTQQQYAIQVGNKATVTNCKACAWCCVGNVPIRRVPIGPVVRPQVYQPIPQVSQVPIIRYTPGVVPPPPQQQQQVIQYQSVPRSSVVTYSSGVSGYATQPQPQPQVISQTLPVPAPVQQTFYYPPIPRQTVVQPQSQSIPQQTVYTQVFRQSNPRPQYQQVPPTVYNQTSYIQSPPPQPSYIQSPPPTPNTYVQQPPPCQTLPPTTTQTYVTVPPPPCQTTLPPYVTSPPTTTTTTTTTIPPPVYETAPPVYETSPPATYATPPTYATYPSPPKKSYVQPPTYVPVPVNSYQSYHFGNVIGSKSTNKCCTVTIQNVDAIVSCGNTESSCCSNQNKHCGNAANFKVNLNKGIANIPNNSMTCEEAVNLGYIDRKEFENVCPSGSVDATEISIPSTIETTNYVLPGGNEKLENSVGFTTVFVSSVMTIVVVMFL
ncbi:unnamed protein product [Caenorhabditis angaria]|uniref:Domain of unknown function DB domain-containing protein n=1 Tax=Caenorhabditis angaria TaxID=860376 RepID=A0A9P1MVV1_9PELO|nr:unnamed protein product [Caenorhabditis angaria]